MKSFYIYLILFFGTFFFSKVHSQVCFQDTLCFYDCDKFDTIYNGSLVTADIRQSFYREDWQKDWAEFANEPMDLLKVKEELLALLISKKELDTLVTKPAIFIELIAEPHNCYFKVPNAKEPNTVLFPSGYLIIFKENNNIVIHYLSNKKHRMRNEKKIKRIAYLDRWLKENGRR